MMGGAQEARFSLAFTKKNKRFELPYSAAPLMDTHAHLLCFWDKDPAETLVRAALAGVRRIVTIYDPVADAKAGAPEDYAVWLQDTVRAAREMLGEHRAHAASCGEGEDADALRALGDPALLFEHVGFLTGVHPYGAPAYMDEVHELVRGALGIAGCAGVGEIGLDYHFDADDDIEAAPHDVQMEAMARQLELACMRGVPVELHVRNDAADEARTAHADAHRVLSEVGVPAAGCVLHCFGEDRATMERFLELGCHIAFGGAATFKRNDAVRAAFAACPLDRLVLETDCPYMAPEPLRGLECEPAMIAQTAAALASDRAARTGEDERAILDAIWKTSTELFGDAGRCR